MKKKKLFDMKTTLKEMVEYLKKDGCVEIIRIIPLFDGIQVEYKNEVKEDGQKKLFGIK